MCMRASGASELRKFWQFYILKLLFLSFCRHIENKPWLNFIWGGKRPPKPPHQYASGRLFTVVVGRDWRKTNSTWVNKGGGVGKILVLED